MSFVFFVPTIISLAFKLIDIGKNGGNAYNDSRSNLSACWDGDYGGWCMWKNGIYT